jgi:hypothetical protein
MKIGMFCLDKFLSLRQKPGISWFEGQGTFKVSMALAMSFQGTFP